MILHRALNFTIIYNIIYYSQVRVKFSKTDFKYFIT